MNTTDTHTPAGTDGDPTDASLVDGAGNGDQLGNGPLASVLRLAFVVTLVLFVLGGTVLVTLQGVQLVLGDGEGAARVAEAVGPPTYLVATVCGLLAFVQCYLQPGRGREQG